MERRPLSAGSSSSSSPASTDDPDSLGQTLIHAAANGYADEITHLLRQGAYIDHKDENDQTALSYGVRNGHHSVVEILLERGATPSDVFGEPQLDFAITKRYHSMAINLLDYSLYSPIDRIKKADRSTALMCAVKVGDQQMAEYLLREDANTEVTDDDKLTPLLHAIDQGKASIVGLLIHYGARLESQTTQSPIHRAVQKGHEEIISVLLRADANLLHTMYEGRTPLELAEEMGAEDIVKLLISEGADANRSDTDGDARMQD